MDLKPRHVRGFLLSDAIVCKDGTKQLHCPAKGTLYRALSADASTAYGLSPAFVVHDELGLVRGPRSELFEALETGSAAQLAPLSVVISTQASGDADLLSVLIDDAQSGRDPRVVCSVYAAPPDADPFALETIKLADLLTTIPKNASDATDIKNWLTQRKTRGTVRNGYMSKIRKLLSNKEAQQFEELYGKRSKLLHEGDGRGQLDEAAEQALTIATALLLADISRPHSERGSGENGFRQKH